MSDPQRKPQRKRVHIPGGDGWLLLPEGRYRVMLHNRQAAHPGAGWFVQERGCWQGECGGQWFSHDGEFQTMAEAIEYAREDEAS